MSFTPPTQQAIYSSLVSDIETEIGQTVPILPVAFVRVISKTLAGSLVLLYKYANWMFFQLFVSTADYQSSTISGRTVVPLIEHGRQSGVGDPIAAVAAILTIDITVTNISLATIPAGTALVYDPTGVTYVTSTGVVLDAATKSVDIEAVSDQAGGSGLGAIGNLDNGATVSFTTALADVDQDAVVTATATQGEDAEDLDVVYRQRVLDYYQKRPQGGALADIEAWAESAAGIINAYPYLSAPPGTAVVYCEADTVSSGSPDGIPTGAQLTAALDAINLDVSGRATRRPANMLVTTQAITRKSYEVDVIGLIADDPAAVQAAITAELDNLFASYEPFIGGLTVVPRDRITSAEVASVVFDVAKATGSAFSSVVLRTNVDQNRTTSSSVIAGSDDARETGAVVVLNSTTNNLNSAQVVGLRFTSVNIPAGATVTSATITVTSSAALDVYTTISVRGEAAANPTTFTTAASNISGRPSTVNTITAVAENWAIDQEIVFDVSEIVEEILTISGWSALNAMAFVLSAPGPGNRSIYAFEGDPTKVAVLDISYTAPALTLSSVQVDTLAEGQKAKVSAVNFP